MSAHPPPSEPELTTPTPQIWPSEPPEDCPFEKSLDLTDVAFTGRYTDYTDGDGWYPSWAADGNLYTAWSDGSIDGVRCSSYGGDTGATATTGEAKIEGDDPLHLKVTPLGISPVPGTPYQGRYPCGSLVYKGVWYYGTYGLAHSGKQLNKPENEFTWDIMGPFVGWRYSTDSGKTWEDPAPVPIVPFFDEPERFHGPVKFGSPVFVDFGKDMEYSPDGKAYIIGHGAVEPDPEPRVGNCSWINGDQIYMARVTPSIDTINDNSQYEFFAGHDALGKAIWESDFSKMQPLVDWNNHCGFATMTYNAPLQKYLMWITDGRSGDHSPYDTYLLESDQITGPWKLVSYLRDFGPQAYFVHLLSKFISANGRSGWVCYCANWSEVIYGPKWKGNPPGSKYGLCFQEIELLGTGKVAGAP